MKYRTKPVVIDAVQYNGSNVTAIMTFTNGEAIYYQHLATPALVIPTLEGDMTVNPGDYVIRGLKGEFYPCKPDIFEMKYQDASEPW